MKEHDYVNFVAGMLSESFTDDDFCRYSRPDSGDVINVQNLIDALENFFPGQERYNTPRAVAGETAEGYGVAVGFVCSMKAENGKLVLFLSEYKNGSRHYDISFEKDRRRPGMTGSEMLEACKKIEDKSSIVVARSRSIGAFGKHMHDVVEHAVDYVKISKVSGMFLHLSDEETIVGQLSGTELNERRMSGPAAARNGGFDEIADMREKLANGVVRFDFMKHSENGDVLRHAIGTTSEQIIPEAERRRLDPNYDENVASYERRSNFIIWFWDLEKNAVRCFNTNRFEGIIDYERTAQRADSNEVQRFGNIYVHRDVDERGSEYQDRAANVEYAIERANAGLGEMVRDLSDVRASDVFSGGSARIQTTSSGDPVLKIEIRKRGTESDPPYQLRLNELRGEILRRWNVDVKRVEVDGVFEY